MPLHAARKKSSYFCLVSTLANLYQFRYIIWRSFWIVLSENKVDSGQNCLKRTCFPLHHWLQLKFDSTANSKFAQENFLMHFTSLQFRIQSSTNLCGQNVSPHAGKVYYKIISHFHVLIHRGEFWLDNYFYFGLNAGLIWHLDSDIIAISHFCIDSLAETKGEAKRIFRINDS